MRLIDADALLDYLTIIPIDLGYREVEDIEEYVKKMPTIEERKTGHWIRTPQACYTAQLGGLFEGGSIIEFECSACHENQMMQSNFCPNCGADMRGEEHG